MYQHQNPISSEFFCLSLDSKVVKASQHGLALIILNEIALYNTGHPSSTRIEPRETHNFQGHARVNLIYSYSEIILYALHL